MLALDMLLAVVSSNALIQSLVLATFLAVWLVSPKCTHALA